MANPEHVEIVKQGADAIREWREKNLDARFDLSGADLSGVDLTGAVLSEGYLLHNFVVKPYPLNVTHIGPNLYAANLANANLAGANLIQADLSDANLREANLTATNLVDAKLQAADLSGANLSGTVLARANLKMANLRGATLYETVLRETNMEMVVLGQTGLMNLDLSNVIGLATVVHEAPSDVGIFTLYRSRGRISEEFLRGCGVPDELIAYMPSLLGAQQAIQFYSCFISYSHKDEEFCKRLHSRMRDEKLRVWYAPEDMKGGRKIHEQIDDAIRVHDKLLLVLSDQSMVSEWVKTEVRRARKREVREGRRILFPIRLVPFEKIRNWEAFDADTGKDMGVEVREYFIPDFSNWKDHDAFEAGFNRLLDDLKAEAAREDDGSGGDASR